MAPTTGLTGKSPAAAVATWYKAVDAPMLLANHLCMQSDHQLTGISSASFRNRRARSDASAVVVSVDSLDHKEPIMPITARVIPDRILGEMGS